RLLPVGRLLAIAGLLAIARLLAVARLLTVTRLLAVGRLRGAALHARRGSECIATIATEPFFRSGRASTLGALACSHRCRSYGRGNWNTGRWILTDAGILCQAELPCAPSSACCPRCTNGA